MTTVEGTYTDPPVTGVELGMDGPRHRPRRRRLIWPALGTLVLAVGAGAWLWTGNETTRPAQTGTGPVATARVERGTISATQTWPGTLGHGAPFTVNSNTDGMVTRLPDQGTTVKRGAGFYRVNERPVTLLYGAVPMYRDLGPGQSGVDVEQFEDNLVELGYEGFTADDTYTSSTAVAAQEWQADLGVAKTGTVSLQDVVFLPEGGRVDSVHVHVGDQVLPGTPILDITGQEQVVNLEVDVDDRDLADVDTTVTVILPGGDEVRGTVSTTAVAEVPPDDSGGGIDSGAAESESIVLVEIALHEQVSDDLVGAPVEVVVAIDERTDVLLVPVNALLALAEGGYGLEVVRDDGTTETIAVDTGLFAEGRVEVRGDGIGPGTVVGVAGR